MLKFKMVDHNQHAEHMIGGWINLDNKYFPKYSPDRLIMFELVLDGDTTRVVPFDREDYQYLKSLFDVGVKMKYVNIRDTIIG